MRPNTRFHLDSNGKDLAIETVQDVEPFIEFGKVARDFEQPSDWGRHTHKVPNVEIVKLMNEEYARGNTTLRLFSPEFDKLFEKKIRSGEWEAYRVDKPALIMGWMGFGS